MRNKRQKEAKAAQKVRTYEGTGEGQLPLRLPLTPTGSRKSQRDRIEIPAISYKSESRKASTLTQVLQKEPTRLTALESLCGSGSWQSLPYLVTRANVGRPPKSCLTQLAGNAAVIELVVLLGSLMETRAPTGENTYPRFMTLCQGFHAEELASIEDRKAKNKDLVLLSSAAR